MELKEPLLKILNKVYESNSMIEKPFRNMMQHLKRMKKKGWFSYSLEKKRLKNAKI